MNLSLLPALATVVLFVAFCGIAAWAYSAGRRVDFDAASRLPLESDEETPR